MTTPCLPECGVARFLTLLNGPWATLIVRELLHGPHRFTELRAALPGISPHTLTSQAREALAGRLGSSAPVRQGRDLLPGRLGQFGCSNIVIAHARVIVAHYTRIQPQALENVFALANT